MPVLRPVSMLIRQMMIIGTGFLALALAGCSTQPEPTIASVFRVEATPCVRKVNQLATAVLVEPDLVLTVAHTFEGISSIQLRGSDGSTTEAEIVYFDEFRDIALLALEPGWLDEAAVPIPFGSPVIDEAVTVVSFASLDGPEIKPGQITQLVTATLDGEGRRAAMKLDADIEAGDSGSPVINEGGEMVGMVFATERGVERGWAIAAKELTSAITVSTDQSIDEPIANPLGCD